MWRIFKFWVMAAGNAHRIPEKEIAKLFVSGLKPDIFSEEIYARSCESLVDAMAETRNELSNYREIMEISDRIKRPEVKKDSKDWMPDGAISRKSGSHTKAPIGASFAKDSKPSNSGNTRDIKDVDVSSVIKRDTTLTSVRMQRRKMGRATSKPGSEKTHHWTKMMINRSEIRQIRIRHSDLNTGYQDPFLRY